MAGSLWHRRNTVRRTPIGANRSRTFGVAEALAVAAPLPAHSRILDVGCGNGVPVTEALVYAGHSVVGLDSSAGMLARFRANLPGTLIVRGDRSEERRVGQEG